ncbi:uncharacterized protein LOC143540385 [Bidens hawaiensis]|uniref:uncharacterized protein LOC143540385 n=1 Tax=Bidens hawaiensis TaxID=980011 RepID=UPI00404BA11B
MATIAHPALTVTNIRNFIPIILELENGQYTSWVELFTIHCIVFEVLDHIIKPEDSAPSTAAAADKGKEKETRVSWDRLDAIVKQWIYGTISNDLLMTVIKPKATAKQAWDAIAHLFQDNQASRAPFNQHQTRIFPQYFGLLSRIKSLIRSVGKRRCANF